MGRWMAQAERASAGWTISAPTLVGPLDRFLECASAPIGSTLLGVDLPIGLPRLWASRAGVTDFPSGLEQFGEGRWRAFFDVAERLEDVSLERPFYPAGRSAGARHQALAERLTLSSPDDLRRLADFTDQNKRSGTPVFWTAGAAQVGRAALSFWKDVLQPARRANAVAIWPFDGSLSELSGAVVAETYPAEAYRWFDLPIGRLGASKRRLEDRIAAGPALARAGDGLGAFFSDAARSAILGGFEIGGEDAFDAMVGLLALVAVVEGERPEHRPSFEAALTVEGWILGRRPPDTELDRKSLE